MKVTSLKDVETYIYSSVIIPLKSLNIPVLSFTSPITGKNGNEWTFSIRPEPLPREFRRNYQRTQAQRKAKIQVVLFNGTTEYVVASYDRKTHEVVIFEHPFRKLAAMPLMGKLHDAFYRNTPFTKVKLESHPPVSRPTRSLPSPRRPQEIMDTDQEEAWLDGAIF